MVRPNTGLENEEIRPQYRDTSKLRPEGETEWKDLSACVHGIIRPLCNLFKTRKYLYIRMYTVDKNSSEPLLRKRMIDCNVRLYLEV